MNINHTDSNISDRKNTVSQTESEKINNKTKLDHERDNLHISSKILNILSNNNIKTDNIVLKSPAESGNDLQLWALLMKYMPEFNEFKFNRLTEIYVNANKIEFKFKSIYLLPNISQVDFQLKNVHYNQEENNIIISGTVNNFQQETADYTININFLSKKQIVNNFNENFLKHLIPEEKISSPLIIKIDDKVVKTLDLDRKNSLDIFNNFQQAVRGSKTELNNLNWGAGGDNEQNFRLLNTAILNFLEETVVNDNEQIAEDFKRGFFDIQLEIRSESLDQNFKEIDLINDAWLGPVLINNMNTYSYTKNHSWIDSTFLKNLSFLYENKFVYLGLFLIFIYSMFLLLRIFF